MKTKVSTNFKLSEEIVKLSRGNNINIIINNI